MVKKKQIVNPIVLEMGFPETPWNFYAIRHFWESHHYHWTLTDFAVLISEQLHKIAFFQVGSSVDWLLIYALLTTDF